MTDTGTEDPERISENTLPLPTPQEQVTELKREMAQMKQLFESFHPVAPAAGPRVSTAPRDDSEPLGTQATQNSSPEAFEPARRGAVLDVDANVVTNEMVEAAILSHFKEGDKQFTYICLKCEEAKLSVSQCTKLSEHGTWNLKKHLKAKHSDVELPVRTLNRKTLSPIEPATECEAPPASQKKVRKEVDHERTLTNLRMDLVAIHKTIPLEFVRMQLAFRKVESPLFKAIAAASQQRSFTRKTLAEVVMKEGDIAYASILDVVSKKPVALCIDGGTNNGIKTMNLAIYCGSQYHHTHAFRTDDNFSSDTVCQMLRPVVDELEKRECVITAFLSDNAADVQLVCATLADEYKAYSMPCMCHFIQILVNDVIFPFAFNLSSEKAEDTARFFAAGTPESIQHNVEVARRRREKKKKADAQAVLRLPEAHDSDGNDDEDEDDDDDEESEEDEEEGAVCERPDPLTAKWIIDFCLNLQKTHKAIPKLPKTIDSRWWCFHAQLERLLDPKVWSFYVSAACGDETKLKNDDIEVLRAFYRKINPVFLAARKCERQDSTSYDALSALLELLEAAAFDEDEERHDARCALIARKVLRNTMNTSLPLLMALLPMLPKPKIGNVTCIVRTLLTQAMKKFETTILKNVFKSSHISWKQEIENFIRDTTIGLNGLDDVKHWWDSKNAAYPRLYTLFIAFHDDVPAGTAAVERMFEVQTRVHTGRRNKSYGATVEAQLRILSSRRNAESEVRYHPKPVICVRHHKNSVIFAWDILQSAISLSWFTSTKTFMKAAFPPGVKLSPTMLGAQVTVIYSKRGVLTSFFNGKVLSLPDLPRKDAHLRDADFVCPTFACGWVGQPDDNVVISEHILREMPGHQKRPPMWTAPSGIH
jgi:hypothetical protein